MIEGCLVAGRPPARMDSQARQASPMNQPNQLATLLRDFVTSLSAGR